MKRFNTLVVFFLVFGICSAQDSQPQASTESSFASFGMEISDNDTSNTAIMTEKYEVLKAADTLQVKFQAKVTEVCQSKGCWMKVELANGEKAMVRFKDYGFFMPLDLAGKEVIVNGLAFVEEMSVEDQQHYAKDAGKSEEEIAKITKPKKTYGFEADGVLVKD